MVRLLFDENISYRIKKKVEITFSETIHVSDTELQSPAKDIDIWNWAKTNHYIIVTYDEDFESMFHIKGFPPKVILLRPGNQSTNNIAKVLISSLEEILSFSINKEIGFLEILFSDYE